MNGAIAKYEAKTGKPIDPATHQWLSAAVGAIVNQAAGMSMLTGAAEAVYGTKWNYLTEDNQKKLGEFLDKALQDSNWDIDDTIYLLNRFGEVSGYNYEKVKEKYTIHEEGMLPAEVTVWEKHVLIKDAMNKVANHYAVDFAYNESVDITGNMQILLDKLQPKSKFGIGESVVENVTAEKANMVPELLLKEKYIVSPVLKGIVKSGGVGIFMTGADMVDAYKKYSESNLFKIEALSLIPVSLAMIGRPFEHAVLYSILIGVGAGVGTDLIKYKVSPWILTDNQKEIDKEVKRFMEKNRD